LKSENWNAAQKTHILYLILKNEEIDIEAEPNFYVEKEMDIREAIRDELKA
jgi:hypothetical protein